ncbi:MAG: allantoate amidohydrolase [Candidatus Dormiibacterota bacterium]
MSAGGDLAAAAMERCDALGAVSEEPDRLTRQFAGEAMQRAHAAVGEWMQKAGMVVRHDNIGNLHGRYEAEATGRPTLLIGSHLDTVRDAGRYDGPLGVMVGIASVQRLHDLEKRLPFAVEVIAFADEEGLRFSSTYLGSRALAGTFDDTDLDGTDADGVTMAEAIRTCGGDPSRIGEDKWQGGPLLGYVEVHIEQGPVLERVGLPVGVVTAIAGQARYLVTFVGEAGHAGTVPMAGRRDALAAAAEFVLAVEAHAGSHEGVVATVGQVIVHPGASNVIPGVVELSLDVRHADESVRAEHTNRILERAAEISGRRGVEASVRLQGDNPSVPCAPRLVSLMAKAIEAEGLPVVHLASGAGHDGVPMSALTDVAMLFVRCKGGVSHNPRESVTVRDVSVSIDVLSRFLELLAEA